MVPTFSDSSEAEATAVAVAVECKEAPEAVQAVASVQNEQDESDALPLANIKMISQEPQKANDLKEEHVPSIVSATVLKRVGDTEQKKKVKVGLSFENQDDVVIISSIDPDSLFDGTPINVGDEVLSVNNTSCDGRNARYVTRLCKRARDSIAIVVRRENGDPYIVSTMVTKPESDSRLGIGVQRVDGSLTISSIERDGLFADSLLNVGDKVVSIGGIPCPCMDSTSAIELIRKETRTVTIIAWTETEAGVVVASRKYQSLVESFLSLLWKWRKELMIIAVTFTLITIIAIPVSQTGHKPACEDLGQRPLPVARECP